MDRRLKMIATVWAYRPMMWLLAIAALCVLVASTTVRNHTKMRRAFIIASEYGSMESVKLSPMSTLKNGEEFQRLARLGEVDSSVEGIDLTSKDQGDPTNPLIDLGALMDRRDPTNPLVDFSSLEQALANYPSVRWIRFDMDQIQHVSNETLSKLSELETIIIHDNQVTQTDVDNRGGGRHRVLEYLVPFAEG